MKKEDGFTYLEIIVAFMIFGLVLVIILRVGDSVSRLTRASEETNQMLHVAELELENYKTGIHDLNNFTSITGFTITEQTIDGEGEVTLRTLEHQNIDNKYVVIIEERMVTRLLKDILIRVTSKNLDIDDVVIQSKIMKDSD